MEQTIALYIFSLIIILGLTSLLFFVAQFKKDNSIIDIAYGLTFIVSAYFLASKKLETFTLAPSSMIILFFVTLWGLRLSSRIYSKNKGKPEDFRYQTWRTEWMKKGLRYYFARAYLQIFILQGFVISIVLLPLTLTLVQATPSSKLILVGIALWIFGFIFESIGDRQLDTFIKNKNKKSTIMTTGLWRYSRHPNYFGESMMWFGIAFVAVSSGVSYAAFLSPLLITYLLLFVSGIPMLEKKWKGIPEWEVYRFKTSAFIPLPPKKI